MPVCYLWADSTTTTTAHTLPFAVAVLIPSLPLLRLLASAPLPPPPPAAHRLLRGHGRVHPHHRLRRRRRVHGASALCRFAARETTRAAALLLRSYACAARCRVSACCAFLGKRVRCPHSPPLFPPTTLTHLPLPFCVCPRLSVSSGHGEGGLHVVCPQGVPLCHGGVPQVRIRISEDIRGCGGEGERRRGPFCCLCIASSTPACVAERAPEPHESALAAQEVAVNTHFAPVSPLTGPHPAAASASTRRRTSSRATASAPPWRRRCRWWRRRCSTRCRCERWGEGYILSFFRVEFPPPQFSSTRGRGRRGLVVGGGTAGLPALPPADPPTAARQAHAPRGWADAEAPGAGGGLQGPCCAVGWATASGSWCCLGLAGPPDRWSISAQKLSPLPLDSNVAIIPGVRGVVSTSNNS